MKRIIGSYSITVTRLIKALRDNLDAVDNLNFRQIEVIIQMFFFKRIMKRLGSDYKHLEEIILLLVRCSKINEMQIGSFAEKALTELFSNVKIPSSICVHSPLMYTPLMPADGIINQKVKLIKSLKRQKARHFVSCLIHIQDKLMSLLDTGLTWKIRMLIVRFITRLQSSLETQANGTSVKAIFDQTGDKHPQMVHLVIRSLLSIFNKVFSLFDYGYDISRAYQSDYDPPFIKNIDTVLTDQDFSSEFKKEMRNVSNQNFFIDSKAFVGWLCWGRPMKALQPGQIEISLQQNEVEVAKVLGRLVTREWLDEITTCLVNDNETRSVFNSGDVSFFVLLIILITKGYADNLSLEDLFSLCRKHYDRDDKAAMIMSAEIVAGLISGSKYMKPSEITLRDNFMANFLADCLDHELSQDAFEIWSTLCWWLPSVVDLRRCKPFYDYFSRIKGLTDAKLEDASHQASVMNMVDSILTGLDMRSPSVEPLLSDLVFDHPHDQLRAAIGKLFSTMCQTQDNLSFRSVGSLLETTQQSSGGLGVVLRRVPTYINDTIVQIFTTIANEEAAVIKKELSPQQIVKTRYFYLASTICYWLQEMLRSPSKVTLVPYLVPHLLPFLLGLLRQRNLCKLGGIDVTAEFLAIAYLPMRKHEVEGVLRLLCCTTNGLESSTQTISYEIKLKLSFIQHFISAKILQLTTEQRTHILEFVIGELYNPNFVEVRTRAADVLSDIVHNVNDTAFIKSLIERFSDNLQGYTWEEKKALSKTDVKVHGSVSGLGAIVGAFPYAFPLPEWIPKQLSQLASWARTTGMAGSVAKSVISEFKKVRADTWRYDRFQFTSEELEDLEGVLWRSYYA